MSKSPTTVLSSPLHTCGVLLTGGLHGVTNPNSWSTLSWALPYAYMLSCSTHLVTRLRIKLQAAGTPVPLANQGLALPRPNDHFFLPFPNVTRCHTNSTQGYAKSKQTLSESTERVRHIRNVSIANKNVHVPQPHILN